MTGAEREGRLPERWPATAQDRVFWASRHTNGMAIHAVIDWQGRVDERRLARAARLALDGEPVLGASFRGGWFRSRWSRSATLPEEEVFSTRAGDDLENETEAFLVPPFPGGEGPQARLLLLRGPVHDRLVVKFNHLVGDAEALRDYLRLLSTLYRELARDPRFRPRPNLRGDRSLRQVLARFSSPFLMLRCLLALWEQLRWPHPKRYWSLPPGEGAPRFLIRTIEGPLFARIRRYARERGATLNDLIVAETLRGVVEVAGVASDAPLRLQGTVDLRRYLPGRRAAGLANLSSFTYLKLEAGAGGDLEETLARVRGEMERRKRRFIGLGDGVMLHCLASVLPLPLLGRLFRTVVARSAREGLVLNILTNTGPMEEDGLDFGAGRVERAFILPPLARPPHLLMGVSGFGESLTFSAGYRRGDGEDPVERLINGLFRGPPWDADPPR